MATLFGQEVLEAVIKSNFNNRGKLNITRSNKVFSMVKPASINKHTLTIEEVPLELYQAILYSYTSSPNTPISYVGEHQSLTLKLTATPRISINHCRGDGNEFGTLTLEGINA